MPDYSRGKIYTIWDSDYTTCYIGSTVQPLCKRMDKHRSEYKKYLKGACRYVSIFDLFDEYDVKNCRIELLENAPCHSKEELHAREGQCQRDNECINKNVAGRSRKEHYEEHKEIYSQRNKEYRLQNCDKLKSKQKEYRNEHKEELNEKCKQWYKDNRDTRIQKQQEYYNEHKDEIKEYKKQYNEEHREELSERRKQYRIDNIDTFKASDKKYYDKNREQKILYQHEYRKNNPDKLKETRTCECGGICLKLAYNRHLKSKMHQQYLKSLEETLEDTN